MRTINDIFPAVFCITLEMGRDAKHPERLAAAVTEFEKHNIEVIYQNGIDGSKLDISEPNSRDGDSVVRKADMGCTLSHLQVVKLAKLYKLKSYFVFEDDVILAENFQEKFAKAMEGVPPDWRLVYAGGDNQEPTNAAAFNEYVKGTAKTLTTHAFGAHERVYDDLIRVLSQHEKVDLNISELHKGGNCWVMEPRLAGQRAGWSYILGKEVQNEHAFFKV